MLPQIICVLPYFEMKRQKGNAVGCMQAGGRDHKKASTIPAITFWALHLYLVLATGEVASHWQTQYSLTFGPKSYDLLKET